MPKNNSKDQQPVEPEKPPTELEQIHMTTNKTQNEVSSQTDLSDHYNLKVINAITSSKQISRHEPIVKASTN